MLVIIVRDFRNKNFKKVELLELFLSLLDNVFVMYNVVKNFFDEFDSNKYLSFGLVELVLEELGKFFFCFVYYLFFESLIDWKEFWKDWRNYDLKVYCVFFYEFFFLIRVEVNYYNVEDEKLFLFVKGVFLKEKEVSFYVDIDKGNWKILKLGNEVLDIECIIRVISLLGLFNVVFYIKDWMYENINEDFWNVIFDYCYWIILLEIY